MAREPESAEGWLGELKMIPISFGINWDMSLLCIEQERDKKLFFFSVSYFISLVYPMFRSLAKLFVDGLITIWAVP